MRQSAPSLNPLIVNWAAHEQELIPTDVFLSVTDVRIDGRWIRATPTIRVEGGSYPLHGAQQLQKAVSTLVAALTTGQGPEY